MSYIIRSYILTKRIKQTIILELYHGYIFQIIYNKKIIGQMYTLLVKNRIEREKIKMDEKKEFAIKLGNYIRKHRLINKLTIQELAFRTNMCDKHLGRIERGEKIPLVSTLNKLQHELGFSYDLFHAKFNARIE